MALQVAELFAKLGVDMDDYKKGMTQAKRDLNGLSDQAKRDFASIADHAKKSMLIMGTALAAGFGAAGVFGTRFNAEMEQAEVAFTTLLGSAEKAKAMIRDLQKTAAETPFEFTGLQNSAKLLLAMGFNAEQVQPALLALGDAVSAIGGNEETMQGVTMAIGQMLTKGKVSAEEMNQLAERGVAAWDIMAENMGKSKAELMQLAAQGKLLASQGLPALLGGMADRYAGAMEKQSKTFNGLMSTLRDNIKMALGGATQGLFVAVKDDINSMITSLQRMSDDGSLEAWGHRIGDTLMSAFESLKAIGSLAVTVAKEIAEHWNVIGPAIVAVAAGFAAMKVIGAITLLWKSYRASVLAATAAQKSFLVALGPARLAMVAIAGVAGIVAANTDTFGKSASFAAEETFKFAQSVGELNKKLAENPLQRSSEEVENMQADMQKVNDLLKEQAKLQEYVATTNERLNNGQDNKDVIADMQVAQVRLMEISKELSKFDITGPESARSVLAKMNVELNKSVTGLLELKRAEISDISTKATQISKSEDLIRSYDELASKKRLDAEETAKLNGIVNELSKAYPAINTMKGEEGRLIITNTNLLRERIKADRDWLGHSAEGLTTYLKNLKISTTQQAEQLRIQLQNLSKLGDGYRRAGEWLGKLVPDGLEKKLSPLGKLGETLLTAATDSKIKEVNDQLSGTESALNAIDKAIADIKGGGGIENPFDGLGGDSTGISTNGGKEDDTKRRAFEAEMSRIQFLAEMHDWSAEKQIKALEDVQAHHKAFLSTSVDDERSILLQIKALREQSAQDSFETSAKWIQTEKDYKRMTLEQELAAWQRVQKRYADGTEQRHQADMEIMRIETEMERNKYQASLDWIDEKKYYNQLSLDEELAAYNRMLARYKKGSEEYKAIAREIYRVEQEMSKKSEQDMKNKLETALKSAEDFFNANFIDTLDEKIKKVNKSATDQVNSLRSAIDEVNNELKAQIAIYDEQIRKLEDSKKLSDRGNDEQAYNERVKALQDQRLWYVMQGEEDHAFEIAALDQKVAEERKAWAEKQSQWAYEDEHQRLEDQKTEAQKRAEARQDELQNQIDTVEKWRDYQVAGMEEEKERLRQFWEDKEKGVIAIMDSGLIETLATMSEKDPEFKARGETMIMELINGLETQKGPLQTKINEIMAMISQVNGAMSSMGMSVMGAINSGVGSNINSALGSSGKSAASTNTADAVAKAAREAVASSMPKSITVVTQVDSQIVAEKSVQLINNNSRQIARA